MTVAKAGRELDALVAEKVMGWNHGTNRNYWWDSDGKVRCQVTDGYHMDEPCFSPSTDIAAAWSVLEFMKTKFNGGVQLFWDGEEWRCWFRDSIDDEYADTAPLAICLAALKAVGYGSSGSYDASSADGDTSNPIAGDRT